MADLVLLNDGTSFVLLNDGTSKILLNGAAPPSDSSASKSLMMSPVLLIRTTQ